MDVMRWTMANKISISSQFVGQAYISLLRFHSKEATKGICLWWDFTLILFLWILFWCWSMIYLCYKYLHTYILFIHPLSQSHGMWPYPPLILIGNWMDDHDDDVDDWTDIIVIMTTTKPFHVATSLCLRNSHGIDEFNTNQCCLFWDVRQ